jgi:hypothetical protein
MRGSEQSEGYRVITPIFDELRAEVHLEWPERHPGTYSAGPDDPPDDDIAVSEPDERTDHKGLAGES